MAIKLLNTNDSRATTDYFGVTTNYMNRSCNEKGRNRLKSNILFTVTHIKTTKVFEYD